MDADKIAKNRELAENLRKMAEELRRCASMEKKASRYGSVKLDPQRVLDFMLFYGR